MISSFFISLKLAPPPIGIVGEPIPLQLISLGASPTMRQGPGLTGTVDEEVLHVIPTGLEPHEDIPMGSQVEMNVPLSYLSVRLGDPLDVRATAEDSGSPTVTDVAPPVVISTGPRIVTSTTQATTSISTSASLTGTETSVQTFSSVLNSSTTSGTVTGVAGFPTESVALGLLLGFVALVMLRRKRPRHIS